MFGFDFEQLASKPDLKILLCNEAYIGDLILSTSLLPVLKQAYPHCKIGFLAGSWAKEVLKDHIYVDWIHHYDQLCFNRRPLPKKERKMQEFHSRKKAINEIQAVDYDIALDLHSYYNENSAHFLFQTEIPLRVGYWGCEQSYFFNRLLMWDCQKYHVLENHKKMLQEIGIHDTFLQNFGPCLSYHTQVERPMLPPNYILIHVGTGEITREWKTSSWKELAHQLEGFGLPLVFIGKGNRERRCIESILSTRLKAENRCDQFSFRQLIEVVKRAKFLVGLESMAGHLAAYCNTPALLIYAGKSSINWRPYSPLCHVIKPDEKLWQVPRKFPPIHTVTSSEVFEKVEKLLFAYRL